MTTDPLSPNIRYVSQVDGQDADAAALAPLAFAGYAHFTALQIRDGRARGLDLHLARLRAGSQALYGQALPDEEVQARLRAAIQAGPPDLSLTATVYSPPANSPSPVLARARACWSAPRRRPTGLLAPCRWRWSSTNACCPG